MAHAFFVIFHIIAIIFGFWMLLISIPLHIFYSMNKSNANKLSKDLQEQTKILKEQKVDQNEDIEASKDANQKVYEQISNELENNDIDKGLWTQAEAESGGDDNKTRSNYIKLRYEKLTKKAG